ncbi:hypothetical protein FN846DRAFT_1001394 [Sphaerosporella brunnea]|uniref:AMP-dependent synthetase/ligase domain-containing protein n=1 Tax=Sphaerosporella brunnea TaxID=1250544 RepID=A0A5J5F4L5_9PEZI|nr:hypothetical protein FN846DRAFT_1001394 [Sphaerosporella brunnea]
MTDLIHLLNKNPADHETPIIRYSHQLGAPISQLFGLETPSALFTWAVETHGEKRCLAFRKIIAHVLETRLLGDWKYFTYAEVGRRVREMGAGLTKLLNGRKVQRLHMAAANSANWFMLSHAAAMVSVELICVNPLLSQRELTHTLTHVPATAVFMESRNLSKLLTPLFECPHVKLIIHETTSEVDKDLEQLKRDIKSLMLGLEYRVTIVSIEELCRIGLEVMESCILQKPTDTGRIWGHVYPRTLNEYDLPYSDVLTNGQVAAGIAGMYCALEKDLEPDDTYLSYLPLYSRLEYTLVNVLLISGVTLGFGTQLETFLLSAPYNQKCCPASYGDIQSFRPSIIFGTVPWWNTIHEKLLKALAMRPIEEQNDFWKWLEWKRTTVGGRSAPLVSFFEKWGRIAEIRATFFGERVRWVGVTCSMMTSEKREFLGLVFGGPRAIMVQGWGLLHMSSDVTFMAPHHHTRTGLGRPLPSVELKLVADVNESAEKSRGIYRGRIHIRGTSISLVKTPRYRTGVDVGLTLATQLSSEEEWINTNRVGEWNSHKQSFRVIDNLLEPLGARYLGDYVPVERLEAIYNKITYVRECVVTHSWRCVDLIGIISVNEIALRQFADSLPTVRIEGLPAERLVGYQLLRQAIAGNLRGHGKKSGLVGFELVGGVVLTFDSWGKGFRTSNGIVDRAKVITKYQKQVEEQAQLLAPL